MWKNVLLVAGAAGFIAVTLMPTPKPGSMTSVCWVFALLPGLVALANHVGTLRQRMGENGEESKHRPTMLEELAAALLLTAVFLMVARAGNSPAGKPEGWAYAGYGAYISTLWFMLVRLNASALSPRFLINSALKVSIAVFIGYIASRSDFFKAGGDPVVTVYFAIGLFHSWAMRALKKTAMATFGITSAWPTDVSLAFIDGLDDDAADVLQEIGITSAQHLATMRAPEVCGRTLYPRGRVLDWIDQAILATHTNGRIQELRTIGIHSAHALVTIAGHRKEECELQKAATERLEEAAKRLGMTGGGLLLVVECIEQDPAYKDLERERCQNEQPYPPVAEAYRLPVAAHAIIDAEEKSRLVG